MVEVVCENANVPSFHNFTELKLLMKACSRLDNHIVYVPQEMCPINETSYKCALSTLV